MKQDVEMLARNWWSKCNDEERFRLRDKYFNSQDSLNVQQIISVYRNESIYTKPALFDNLFNE